MIQASTISRQSVRSAVEYSRPPAPARPLLGLLAPGSVTPETAAKPPPIPGSKALKNPQHEQFSGHLADDCYRDCAAAYDRVWGALGQDATNKTRQLWRAQKLANRTDIRNRVAYLRDKLHKDTVPDRRWINQIRERLAVNAIDEHVRLTALRDIERAAGYVEAKQAPGTVLNQQINIAGGVGSVQPGQISPAAAVAIADRLSLIEQRIEALDTKQDDS